MYLRIRVRPVGVMDIFKENGVVSLFLCARVMGMTFVRFAFARTYNDLGASSTNNKANTTTYRLPLVSTPAELASRFASLSSARKTKSFVSPFWSV
jgi:hypothetical protein